MAKNSLKEFLIDNPIENYYPEVPKSEKIPIEDARKQYTYLRKIANERLRKLSKERFSKGEFYNRYKNSFRTTQKSLSDAELYEKLYEVRKFIDKKLSLVSYQKKREAQILDKAHKFGLDFLTSENLYDFGKYMEYLRAKYQNQNFDSERAVVLFGFAEAKAIDPLEIGDKFEEWKRVELADIEEAKKDMSESRNLKKGSKKSADEWLNELTRPDQS